MLSVALALGLAPVFNPEFELVALIAVFLIFVAAFLALFFSVVLCGVFARLVYLGGAWCARRVLPSRMGIELAAPMRQRPNPIGVESALGAGAGDSGISIYGWRERLATGLGFTTRTRNP
jgi:hypothetical protein